MSGCSTVTDFKGIRLILKPLMNNVELFTEVQWVSPWDFFNWDIMDSIIITNEEFSALKRIWKLYEFCESVVISPKAAQSNIVEDQFPNDDNEVSFSVNNSLFIISF